MRKFSSINSFLISIYFYLYFIQLNPKLLDPSHLRIICGIMVTIILTIWMSHFSVVYCLDEVIDPDFCLNSETVALKPVSDQKNLPTFTDHVIAVSGLVMITLFIIWRFSKGDSTALAVNPKIMISNG
jgi:hypothetical protein